MDTRAEVSRAIEVNSIELFHVAFALRIRRTTGEIPTSQRPGYQPKTMQSQLIWANIIIDDTQFNVLERNSTQFGNTKPSFVAEAQEVSCV